MTNRRTFVVGILLLLSSIASVSAAASPTTIVAFGDSTTAPRKGITVYADLLQQEMSGEGGQVRVVNAGVPGNTTAMAVKRFDQDVLTAKPNVVIIQFGINDSTIDVWKSPPATEARVPLPEYRALLTRFIRTLKERRIEVVLMTPNPLRWTPGLKRRYGKPPYRADASDGFNASLVGYVEAVRRLAASEKVPLIDVYAAFNKVGAKTGASVDELLLDGMHPNDKGHRLVADLLIAHFNGEQIDKRRKRRASTPTADGGRALALPSWNSTFGPCYFRMHSTAAEIDEAGLLIERVETDVFLRNS